MCVCAYVCEGYALLTIIIIKSIQVRVWTVVCCVGGSVLHPKYITYSESFRDSGAKEDEASSN